MDYKWKELFTQVRSQYIICPHCGKKTFVEPLQNCTCSECGKVINRPATLKVGHYNIPIVPGQQIYQSQVSEVSSPDDYKKVAATVVRNPKNPNLWGIRNESGVQWTVTIPNGEVKLVGNGNAMPASPGLKIRFSRDGNGEII
jgi:ribosomal protein S27E